MRGPSPGSALVGRCRQASLETGQLPQERVPSRTRFIPIAAVTPIAYAKSVNATRRTYTQR